MHVQNLLTWNTAVKEDKSMHVKDFFGDKIGADTSKVRLHRGLRTTPQSCIDDRFPRNLTSISLMWLRLQLCRS